MIPNFPEMPANEIDALNTERMKFWREWLKGRGINTILELGRSTGYGSTWFFVESGAEVWSVDIGGTIDGKIAPIPGWEKYGGANTFHALELLKMPNFHMIVADDTTPIPEIDGRLFDLVFLDTSHQYKHTVYELKRYYPQALKWFAVDDYHWGDGWYDSRPMRDPGVNQACKDSGLPFRFIGGVDIWAVDKLALLEASDGIMRNLRGY